MNSRDFKRLFSIPDDLPPGEYSVQAGRKPQPILEGKYPAVPQPQFSLTGLYFYQSLRRPLLLDQQMDCPTCHQYAKQARFAANYGMSPKRLSALQ